MRARIWLTGLLTVAAVPVGSAMVDGETIFKGHGTSVMSAHLRENPAATCSFGPCDLGNRNYLESAQRTAVADRNRAFTTTSAAMEAVPSPSDRAAAALDATDGGEDSVGDVGLMALFGGGLLAFQLRRKQKSLKHSSLTAA